MLKIAILSKNLVVGKIRDSYTNLKNVAIRTLKNIILNGIHITICDLINFLYSWFVGFQIIENSKHTGLSETTIINLYKICIKMLGLDYKSQRNKKFDGFRLWWKLKPIFARKNIVWAYSLLRSKMYIREHLSRSR